MTLAPKRPPPEYISKLQARAAVWSRQNDDANITVFADLDAILDSTMKEAYRDEHYEGFAFIERLKHYLNITFPAKLKGELDYIKKLPE